jgi:putative transcriptional regulator
MNISHHIPEETLTAYATGNLGEAWSLLVATHLALCPACREVVREVESVGGALLDTIDETEVGANAFDHLMQAIDDLPLEQKASPARSARAVPAILPEPLRSYLGGDIYALKWRRLGMGVFHIPIRMRGTGAKARLLKVPAGKPVPVHSHNGEEMTLVLIGAFQTHQGAFGRGDVELADPSVEHMPVAAPGEDCICLAVTDAPLRFRSLAARIVQPFIGI